MAETLYNEKIGNGRWSACYRQQGGINVLYESGQYSCRYDFYNDADWEVLKAKTFGPNGPDFNKMQQHASDRVAAMP